MYLWYISSPYRDEQGEELGKMGEYELDPRVKAHYSEGTERDRMLGGGAGRLEYLRTWQLLAGHLPSGPATVVDVSGEAGVYTLCRWPRKAARFS